jgi:hypothetical protein
MAQKFLSALSALSGVLMSATIVFAAPAVEVLGKDYAFPN